MTEEKIVFSTSLLLLMPSCRSVIYAAMLLLSLLSTLSLCLVFQSIICCCLKDDQAQLCYRQVNVMPEPSFSAYF